MGYSSKIQAKDMLTSVNTLNSSSILYASDNSLNLGTTFYINEAKTTLAPSGSYVIPIGSGGKSYYITLGSNGKMVSPKEELFTSSFDTNWVQSFLYSGSARRAVTMSFTDGNFPNSDRWPGGLDIELSQSVDGRIYMTDTLWLASNAGVNTTKGAKKAWAVDNGWLNSPSRSQDTYEFSTDDLIDIEVTDMKGYEFRVIAGEWFDYPAYGKGWYGDNSELSEGFKIGNVSVNLVHLAADLDRVITTGSLTYTFTPDYMSVYDTEESHPTWMFRMPDWKPIKDKFGNYKTFAIQKNDSFIDLVVSGSGTPHDWGDRTFKEGNWYKKGRSAGVIARIPYSASIYDGVGAKPAYEEPNFGRISSNVNGSVDEFPYGNDFPVEKQRMWYDGETFPAQYLVYGNAEFGNRPTALIMSLVVDDYTWNNGSAFGIAYNAVNPYHWTTQLNSGTGEYDKNPANVLNDYFGENDWIELNYEGYTQPWNNSTFCQSLDSIYKNISAYAISTGKYANWSERPKFSCYSQGMYTVAKESANEDSFRYYHPSVASASVLAKGNVQIYDDVMSGSVNWYSVINEQFKAAKADSFGKSYCSNYYNDYDEKWHWYGFVHNYDVQSFIRDNYLTGSFGSGSQSSASFLQLCSYNWEFHEPVAGANVPFVRNEWAYPTSGNDGEPGRFAGGSRLVTSPSMRQTAAVWSMAYGDGMYWWNDGDTTFRGFKEELYYWWRYYGWDGSTEGNVSASGLQALGSQALYKNPRDWMYMGYWQVLQHKDIIEDTTYGWKKPEVYDNNNSRWTSGYLNYPIMLYNQKMPISAYKLSADGTEALLIIHDGWNNGYTKGTHRIRIPEKGNREFIVNTWGTFTSVIRIQNL